MVFCDTNNILCLLNFCRETYFEATPACSSICYGSCKATNPTKICVRTPENDYKIVIYNGRMDLGTTDKQDLTDQMPSIEYSKYITEL